MKLRRLNSKHADILELFSGNHKLFHRQGYNQEDEPPGEWVADSPDNSLRIHFISDSFDMSLAGKGFKVYVTVFSCKFHFSLPCMINL